MLIRVFLHAEFISAMKTVPNPTIFVKNAKKKKKKIVLVISVNFLRFSLKLFSIITEKVIKFFFRWKRRQILSRATKGNSNPRLKGNRKGIIVIGKEFYIPILNSFPTR